MVGNSAPKLVTDHIHGGLLQERGQLLNIERNYSSLALVWVESLDKLNDLRLKGSQTGLGNSERVGNFLEFLHALPGVLADKQHIIKLVHRLVEENLFVKVLVKMLAIVFLNK